MSDHDMTADGAAEEADAGTFGAEEGHLTGRTIDMAEAAAAAAAATGGNENPPEQSASPVPDAGEAVARALAERDEYRADLQRLAAEFDNFRKRAVREREQAAAAADHRLLVELLGVLDDFERALATAGDGEAHEGIVDGIRMVHTRLLGVLTGHGLTEIDTQDGFDPHRHEAMMMQPGSGKPEGTVLVVVQKGWEMDGRVLRHAKVIVADGSGDAASEAPATS